MSIESKSPLVTIYITNYNYGNFIEKSIESVLKQTLQDFELIIIDDGSTDDSKEIIERYQPHPKISVIYQQNKGLNVTNNIAMRASNGKYLMRLDADDFLEPKAIELMSLVLEQDEELGLVFPDYYYVNVNGGRIGEEKRHDFGREVTLYDRPAHGACTMIRSKFLKQLGGYNESFTCQDGYDLWIKFITHHKVTNINETLFSYRQHGNNLTSNEERILSTRKRIKEIYVKEHFKVPDTLVVIPVRNTFIGNINLPIDDINGISLLERKIRECQKLSNVKHIVISSSDNEILNYSQNKYSGRQDISILQRPQEFSRLNETLGKTMLHAYEHVVKKNLKIEAIMSLAIEYPFTTAESIQEAINTLALFKSDSVLSVRPDNKMYYQHTGHTLTPILDQEKFTKLEREAIYKGAGGIMISKVNNFLKSNRLVFGRISHIVVDEKTAFGIFSEFDFATFFAFDKLYATS